MTNLIFAFAVSAAHVFEPKHFGDADYYQLFKWNKEGFEFIEALENPFKNFDETQGARHKGEQISEFLLTNKVQVIVSKRYGKNVQVVNQSFLPVITDSTSRDECFSVLENYIDALLEGLTALTAPFPVFALRDGALKQIDVKAS